MGVTAQRAPFDIGISGISMTPAVIAPGRTFALAGGIRNTSRSTGIYQLRIYLSPDQAITATDQQLSTNLFSLAGSGRPLATAAITLPSSIAVGKYFVGVILESGGPAGGRGQGGRNLDLRSLLRDNKEFGQRK